MDYTTIGIDVSKVKLDIFFDSTKKLMTVSNNFQGFGKLLHYIQKYSLNVDRIIVEHTGSYQKELVSFLHNHNMPVCLVHPAKVRNYAKAVGRLAKTDKIDAQILSNYGKIMQPEISEPEHPNVKKLRELVKYRRQLTDCLVMTKQWREKKPDPQILQRISSLVEHLKFQIEEIEAQILQFIKSNETLYKRFQTLIETKGIGKISASILISELPELGYIPKNKIVALCGLAPMNRDSGTLRGKACIQGGRKIVRNALYMSIISAIRTNDVIHQYYSLLKGKGKPSRVAMVACMRKLIIHLNQELQSS